jgi:5-methylcytosine-specific restriction protein B
LQQIEDIPPGAARPLQGSLDASRGRPSADVPVVFQPTRGHGRRILDTPFSVETFDFFEGIARDPTRAFYAAHRDEFKQFVYTPFRSLFKRIIEGLPDSITDTLDSRHDLFSRIPKNDFGRGGAWPFYWAALHVPGESRIESPQLFMWINETILGLGFSLGVRGTEYEQRLQRNLADNEAELATLLPEAFDGADLSFGDHEPGEPGADFSEWLADITGIGPRVESSVRRDELLTSSEVDLASLGVDTFTKLFPLVILSLSDTPMPAVRRYLQVPEAKAAPLESQPHYPLTECAADTGFSEQRLAGWVRAIERHGQAIVYGPPGTGKTFVAEHVARHLIGGADGFMDLLQFHPAYAYEDFMQGIRPQVTEEGSLDYRMVPGRFMEFCRRAERRKGRCVLILDEINRANLSRVFGELMYLMEYRGRSIPLAGGERFRIPENLRMLGTMNTADRSIALVDHALRRRFAFLPLYPDFDVLRTFHLETGFDPEPLIRVLTALNSAIGDRHYEIGISYFMRPDIASELQEIWSTQVEPYLEEYFFDQPAKPEAFRWAEVRSQLEA